MDIKDYKKVKKHRKRRVWITLSIALVCVIALGGIAYQGFRMTRDAMLRQFFTVMIDNDEKDVDIDIYQAAESFERLNGEEPQEKKPQIESTPISSQEKAEEIVDHISEADKNRAIAIVSSVASVDDCISLYNLAANGDTTAKQQLKDIYGRLSESQKDELWELYDKNKHLL